jgi:hypothetical protein
MVNMGMYNEAYKSCYNCGARCEIQIPQVVLGFGGFDLDNPDSMRDLSQNEKEKLSEYVNQESFYCGHDSCNSSFTVKLVVGKSSESTVLI